MWDRDDNYFCEVFQCYAFPQCHIIQMKFSPGHYILLYIIYSGVALLNQLTKGSDFFSIIIYIALTNI